MSFLLTVLKGIGVVILIVCSICVTSAALFPPKDSEGKSELQNEDSD